MTEQQLSRKRSTYVNATSRYRNALWWNEQPGCPESHTAPADLDRLATKASTAKAQYLAAVRDMWSAAMHAGDTRDVDRYDAARQLAERGIVDYLDHKYADLGA